MPDGSGFVAKCEHWLPVVDWEGYYEVSDQGRVRSLARVVTARLDSARPGLRKTIPAHDMTLIPRKCKEAAPPYFVVQFSRGKTRVTPFVHRLVLEAFVGPCPEGMEGCHDNGDSLDNRLENLYWGTRSQNNMDRVRHGRHHNANKTHCPWGHPLKDPNLMNDHKPYRACKACGWACRANKKARRAGLPFDHQKTADVMYARIMARANAA